MSTVKSKKLQVGTDATSSNNFTIYQPSSPDGTLRIGVGNADSPTEVLKVTSSGLDITGDITATGSGLGTSGPAFSAYLNGNQTGVSLGTFTVVQMSAENFDTDGCYDTSNYRFTPNVAGYYQVTFNFGAGAGTIQAMYGGIRKNGSSSKFQGIYMTGTSVDDYYGTVSQLVQMNGTTDYIDFIWFQVGGTGTIQSGTEASAFLAKAL